MSERNKRNYDEEFKRQAVRLYFEQGKSYRVLRAELGVPEATFRVKILIKNNFTFQYLFDQLGRAFRFLIVIFLD
ncbi:MAG: hypothetical protein A3E87_06460 [Gammaproteobacteria bacterium RIFCSPHIGHO2_12_FULL_35_23]|nr:MAG: hypothetical protein A3E87_06460 [Gammaproteobacteria bacterium RIFCSPHIGHO2_12_FULL_35_23]